MKLRPGRSLTWLALLIAFVATTGMAAHTWVVANSLRPEAQRAALTYLDQHRGVFDNDRYVFIVDLTRPSYVERGHLLDRHTGEVNSFLVAHGKGSGWARVIEVTNDEGSHGSAPGAYRTGERRTAERGAELPLQGLELGRNDQAANRDFALFGAPFVGWGAILENQGRLGRSMGSPVVAPEVVDELVDKLGSGALLYVHWEPPPGRRGAERARS